MRRRESHYRTIIAEILDEREGVRTGRRNERAFKRAASPYQVKRESATLPKVPDIAKEIVIVRSAVLPSTPFRLEAVLLAARSLASHAATARAGAIVLVVIASAIVGRVRTCRGRARSRAIALPRSVSGLCKRHYGRLPR